MGRFKWKTLGIRYSLENTEPPSAQAVDHPHAFDGLDDA
jgi:hypothetical protein